MNAISDPNNQGIRKETDSLGEVGVPANKLWGAQTQRSLEHFSIGQDLIPREMITAYAILKKAAATANHDSKRLDDQRYKLIVQTCDEILAGQHHDMFPLHVWEALERDDPVLVRPLLLIQFLLLGCVLVFSVIYDPAANPHGLLAVVVAMFAVSAMGCQFALLRLALPGSPSTAVMTGNLTNSVLSLLDTLFPRQPLMGGANEMLKKTLKVLVGFFVGCIAGAAAVSLLGDWAWLPPVVLAGVALALG
jgi:hypothetical protein